MNVEFKKLDNGLTIINDKMNVDSTSIGVWVGSGSSKEPVKKRESYLK